MKRLSEKVNWDNSQERCDLLDELDPLIGDWQGELPNMRDIFQPEQIERLLSDAVCHWAQSQNFSPIERFVGFVARSGYRHEPIRLDSSDNPLRRTTALHHVYKQTTSHNWGLVAGWLFEIYNRVDLNYVDGIGVDHYSVALKYNCRDFVKKYRALKRENRRLTRLFDSNRFRGRGDGARRTRPLYYPNRTMTRSARSVSLLPLHEALSRRPVDAVDIPHSRTPTLQLAITSLQPDAVKALLGRGADPTSFVFPAEHFALMAVSELDVGRLRLASGLLACLEPLEKKGYELAPRDALTIAKLLLRCGFLDRSANVQLFTRKMFTEATKNLMIKPGLSLHDLIYEQPDLVWARGLTARDCYDLTDRNEILPWLREIDPRYDRLMVARLGQIIARGFCRRWRTTLLRLEDDDFCFLIEEAFDCVPCVRAKDMDWLYDEELVKLKSSREKVNWDVVEERRVFLHRLCDSICNWRSPLPNVRDIFRKEEIDFLLSDSIELGCRYYAETLVSFVARSGYRDDDHEAEVDARRTTPVHLVSRRRLCNGAVVAHWLFKIYARFDVNYSDESGLTHFHVACEYGCDDVVRKFLELGQDPDCLVPSTGDSALHLAVAGGHAIVARTLLRHDAVPNPVNAQGWTPLDLICRKADDEAAMFLQMFHENSVAHRRESLVNARDRRGNTQLHSALNSWRRVLAEALLRFGADPNAANSRGMTPLHLICKSAKEDGRAARFLFLRLVLDNAAACEAGGEAVRVNARNNEGDTPLHLALKGDQEACKCVELLLRAGADPNLANEVGVTALHSIGKERHCSDTVKLLFAVCEEIGQPVRLDARDASGMSPLHYALLWNDEAEIVKLLLRAGASPNYPSGRGSTPLHVAVASLMPEAVQALLDGGADLADFDFPTASDFHDYYRVDLRSSDYAFLRLVRTLDCVERLEASGRGSYELDHSGALTIVDFCRERGVFACAMPKASFWSENGQELVKNLKDDNMRIKGGQLCLSDLFGAKVEDAAERVTYADCYDFADRLPKLPSRYHAQACRPLCEIISRRFFRHWAVEFFLDLTRCRLPIICCEKIIDDSLARLRSLRENVDLENANERRNLLDRLYPLAKDWVGQFPNLRDVFEPEEIESLISAAIDHRGNGDEEDNYRVERLVSFVARSGYRDAPRLDPLGDPITFRGTPMHRLALRQDTSRDSWAVVAYWLFKIYDRFDLNYIDDRGLTHFHVACEYGLDDVVRKFLQLGLNPNCLVPSTGDSPLHLAVTHGHMVVARSLLRHNAVPNWSNDAGSTPLDLICRKTSEDEAALFLQIFYDSSEAYRPTINARDRQGDTQLHVALSTRRRILAEALLRNGADPNAAGSGGRRALHAICEQGDHHDGLSAQFLRMVLDERRLNTHRAWVDARDDRGRSALQLAVQNLTLDCVDLLLDNGADVEDFVFPDLAELEPSYNIIDEYYELTLVARILRVIDRLRQRGYVYVGRDGILRALAEFYRRRELFETRRDREINWRGAADVRLTPSLTLYDLVELRPREAARRISYSDYIEIVTRNKFLGLPGRFRNALHRHLCEKLARGFFREWALNCFLELTRYELPHVCCRKVIEMLTNRDLSGICLAYMLIPEDRHRVERKISRYSSSFVRFYYSKHFDRTAARREGERGGLYMTRRNRARSCCFKIFLIGLCMEFFLREEVELGLRSSRGNLLVHYRLCLCGPEPNTVLVPRSQKLFGGRDLEFYSRQLYRDTRLVRTYCMYNEMLVREYKTAPPPPPPRRELEGGGSRMVNPVYDPFALSRSDLSAAPAARIVPRI
ncbi:unnamed protein product [Trichogramma brassicae]|uniref:Uncharacterized protein n=1 Tax=Trichogramma brassicae TaxID=86971 RepID=A0A6H5HUY0_9HYME|nr:unnamed protein product [Trichogramma brassicae]